MIIRGFVEDNKLKLANEEQAIIFLRTFQKKHSLKLIQLDVIEPKRFKTLQQLRFIHKGIRDFALEIGEDFEDMKYYLKDKFLGFDKEVLGETVRIVPSLEKLTIEQMTEFIEKCLRFMAEQGFIWQEEI